jgi:hypothetical protein
MARQINDALELEQENNRMRDTFLLLKMELHRIRKEYFLGAFSLSETAIDEVDEELETLSLAIENILF